jgi:hypothetical protein
MQDLQLSEAVKLGRLLMTPVPNWQDDGHGGGCGIGMGLRACSVPVSKRQAQSPLGMFVADEETLDAAMEAWPWLSNVVPRYSCDCFEVGEYIFTYGMYLAHLFDEHVFGLANWTFDEWVTYIESVEAFKFPSEAELQKALSTVA